MFGVVVQLFDYLVKAAVAYAETPEGEKELQDILDATEGTDFDMTAGEQPLQVSQVKQAAAAVKSRVKRSRR